MFSGIRVRDPGSGMGKKPGSGIRDKHPGSATLSNTYTLLLRFPSKLVFQLLCSMYRQMLQFRHVYSISSPLQPYFFCWRTFSFLNLSDFVKTNFHSNFFLSNFFLLKFVLCLSFFEDNESVA